MIKNNKMAQLKSSKKKSSDALEQNLNQSARKDNVLTAQADSLQSEQSELLHVYNQSFSEEGTPTLETDYQLDINDNDHLDLSNHSILAGSTEATVYGTEDSSPLLGASKVKAGNLNQLLADSQQSELEEDNKETEKEESEGSVFGNMNWMMLGIGAGAIGALGGGYFLLKPSEKEETVVNKVETLAEGQYAIQGTVVLGPAVPNNGFYVEVWSKDGELLGTHKTDDQGRYQVLISDEHSLLKIRAVDNNKGPDYRDEATGELKDFEGTLLTVLELNDSFKVQTAHINPMTTLASRMMGLDADGKGEFPTSDKINQANQEIAKNLLGSETLDLASYNVVPLVTADGAPITPNEGGNILGLISALESANDLTTDELMQNLIDNIAFDDQGKMNGVQLRETLKDGVSIIESKYGSKVKDLVDSQFIKAEIVSLDEPVIRENVAPEGSNNIIELGEDKTHQFTLSDFGFVDLNDTDSLASVRLHRVPAKGYLRLGDEDITGPVVLSRADIANLTYKGRADESGTSYSVLTFSVSDGELESEQQSIIFDLGSINDAPSLRVEESFDSLFGEVKKINTSSEGNQDDPDLIALEDGSFITVWIDNQKDIKAQKFHYAENFNGEYILVKDSEEFRINHTDTTEEQRLYNPEIAADLHGDFAVQWWKSEGSTTTSYVEFFDEKNGSIGDGEQELGLQYLTKSIISTSGGLQAVGYIAVGYIKNTTDQESGAHVGVKLYDEGVYVKTIEIQDLPGFGLSDLVLTPVSHGGFAATFRIISDEINEIGFAQYSATGDLLGEVFRQESDLGADEELEMVELLENPLDAEGNFIGATLIVFNRKGEDLVLQGWKGNTPVFTELVANETNALTAENIQVIALKDGGFFTLWSLPDDTKGDAIIGRYFDKMGNPLTSEIDIFHLDPGFSFGGVSVDQLENGRLQLAWSDDRGGSDDIYMSTLNLDKLQHNLQDNVTVGQAFSEDIEGSAITFSLKHDANGLFAIDSETGLISVADPVGISASEETSFMIKVQVDDDEGESFDIEHQVKFPGSLKEEIEETTFVLTDEAIDITSLGDINELTLADLIELGILKPTDLGQPAPGPSFQNSEAFKAYVETQSSDNEYAYVNTMLNLIG